MTGNTFASSLPSDGFGPDCREAGECRRLRLALGLNAEKMALVAEMPGRWAWLSVENGYEPIDAGRWALCLAEIDNRSASGVATPRYHFETIISSSQVANPRR